MSWLAIGILWAGGAFEEEAWLPFFPRLGTARLYWLRKEKDDGKRGGGGKLFGLYVCVSWLVVFSRGAALYLVTLLGFSKEFWREFNGRMEPNIRDPKKLALAYFMLAAIINGMGVAIDMNGNRSLSRSWGL